MADPQVKKVKKDKKKKDKKKSKKESTEAVAEETPETPEVSMTPAEETTEKDKKKKKKDKKKKDKKKSKKDKEASPEGDDKKKKKKDKKKKDKKKEKSGSSSSDASASGAKMGLYVQTEANQKLSKAEVEKFRKEADITVGDDCKLNPVTTFDQIRPSLPSGLDSTFATFETPTAIQAQTWPLLLSGLDVIGVAETGSGKTLGFTIPGLTLLAQQPALSHRKRGPLMLVVAPTRELAMQINDVVSIACASVNMRSCVVYGGVPKGEQIKALRQGVHVVVCTPGRLKGLIEERVADLSGVVYGVLDEADRMLDMGFEPDIKFLFSKMTDPKRQTVMFSATWPPEVQAVANQFLSGAVRVNIGDPDSSTTVNKRVAQKVEVLEDRQKDGRLRDLMKGFVKKGTEKCIVFVLFKKEVATVERFLQRCGYKAGGISSNKRQFERTQVLNDFKAGKNNVLVATDVAARGLDIPNVEHVINYSFPLTVEDYVHRIGRTGRGGKFGNSHTFFTSYSKNLSGELINLLKASGVDVPESLMKFGTGVKRKAHGMYGMQYRRTDDRPMPKKKHMKFD